MTTLFLYGTLKRGQRNHGLMRGQVFLGTAVTEARYVLVDCGPYPGLIEPAAGGRAVKGELWRVDADALVRLDSLEAVPYLYVRRELLIAAPEGAGTVEAYFYNRAADAFPHCGDEWPAG